MIVLQNCDRIGCFVYWSEADTVHLSFYGATSSGVRCNQARQLSCGNWLYNCEAKRATETLAGEIQTISL